MFLFPIVLSAFVLAPEDAPTRYVECLATIERDAETGREAARSWIAAGGGANARHCLAMGDLAAGYHKLGAKRLEDIATRNDAGDDFVRARLYAQAAEAWLRAQDLELASAAIAAAFEHAPGGNELHLTAAKIHAARGNRQETIAAVNAAEQSGFATPDGYYLRGRAYLDLGQTEAAAEDVVRALSIDFRHIDSLTLRGDVQRAGVPIEANTRMIHD